MIDLSESGVGCYWGCSFAGVFGYADDIVLLAPCASSLRIMLDSCSSFAMSHKLEFNANKTQLICFTAPGVSPNLPSEWNITNIKKYHFDTMSSFFVYTL